MRANCIICAEYFLSTSVVSATSCGHTFHQKCLDDWTTINASCPQCRSRQTRKDIIRKLYFDTGPESSFFEDDEECMQHRNRINELEASLREAKVELQNIQKDLKEQTELAKCLQASLNECEHQKERLVSEKEAQKMQLSYYKEDLKTMNGYKIELDELRENIKQYKHVETLLNGSVEEAKKVLDEIGGYSVHACRELASQCALLKKQLLSETSAKIDFKSRLESEIIEVSSSKTKLWDEKCKTSDLNNKLRELSEELVSIKEELAESTAEIERLQQNAVKDSENRKPFSLTNLRMNFAKDLSSDDADDEKEELFTTQPPEDMTAKLKRTVSDGNVAKIKHLETVGTKLQNGCEATKSTTGAARFSKKCVAPAMLTGIGRASNSANTSIFKSSFSRGARSGTGASISKICASSGVGYDGLGGHSKPDRFPIGAPKKAKVTASKRGGPSSSTDKACNSITDYIIILSGSDEDN